MKSLSYTHTTRGLLSFHYVPYLLNNTKFCISWTRRTIHRAFIYKVSKSIPKKKPLLNHWWISALFLTFRQRINTLFLTLSLCFSHERKSGKVFTLKQGGMSKPDVVGFAWILVTLFIFFPAQEGRLKTSSNVFYYRTNFGTCTVLLHMTYIWAF